MERQFYLTYSGQEVQTGDLNLVGEDAGLADDRVFAELFRLTPYNGTNVAKGILPYGTGPIVSTNGASGTVLVNPFRALIGSNTAVGTDAKKNWRDVRSTVFVGSTTLTTTQSFVANTSGNPRWDLVYVRIDRDINESTVSRYVKSAGPPITETPTSLSVVKITSPVLGVVTGTPSATPAYPSIPSDGAGSYYIPIAYVRIPNGFSATSTVATTDVCNCSPIIQLAQSVVGVKTARPASTLNNPTGPLLTKTVGGESDWGSSGSRPQTFMPPTMVGQETLWIPLDVQSTSSTSLWSLPPGSVLDNSKDWRNRLWKYTIVFKTGSLALQYPWEQGITPSSILFTAVSNTHLGDTIVGMGQSFMADGTPTPAGQANVMYITSAILGASNLLRFYVDMTTGELKFQTDGTFPNCMVFVELTASGQYTNH